MHNDCEIDFISCKIFAGWHNKINRIAVGRKSLASAVSLIKDSIKETGWAKEDIIMGVSDRRQRKAYTRLSKAFTTAFNKYDEHLDLKELVRFGGHQAERNSLVPWDDYEGPSDSEEEDGESN